MPIVRRMYALKASGGRDSRSFCKVFGQIGVKVISILSRGHTISLSITPIGGN
jgi:hypothetical protein